MLRSRSTLVRESHLARKTGGLQSLSRSGKGFSARGVRDGNLAPAGRVPADEAVDRLLKGLLVLARTVEEVLEIRAVRAGVPWLCSGLRDNCARCVKLRRGPRKGVREHLDVLGD